MTDIQTKIKKLGYAHKKQLKRLLDAKQFAKTPEAIQSHEQAVKSFLEVGKAIIMLENVANLTQSKIHRAASAMHQFNREI